MPATLRFFINGGVVEFENVVSHDHSKMVFVGGHMEFFQDLWPTPPSDATTIAALNGTVSFNGVDYTNTTYQVQLIY